MKIANQVVIIILLGLFTFCSRTNNHIIETDIQSLMAVSTKAQTVDEAQKSSNEFIEKVIKNTVGKNIPQIIITSPEGGKINLTDLLNKKTIIVSSDIYCGFGLESLTNDFPKAIQQIEQELQDIDIVCLLKRKQLDFENPAKFNKALDELKFYFPSFYIIEDIDAKKLNLFANPTRLYIDKNQIVTYMGFGISTIEGLINEIKSLEY